MESTFSGSDRPNGDVPTEWGRVSHRKVAMMIMGVTRGGPIDLQC